MINHDTTTVSDLWQSLGTFWSQLPDEDKDLIETIWQGYVDEFSTLYDQLDVLKSSTAISSITSYVDSYNEYFDIIYSGTALYSGLVNTELIDGDYNYYFNDNRLVLEISGLESEYYDADGLVWNSAPLVEDVAYVISADGERLHFLNHPPIYRNLNNDYFFQGDLFAEKVCYLNPVIFNVYGAMVNADKKLFIERSYSTYKNDYNTSGEELRDLATHFKNMFWGLRYFKQSRPKIDNIKKALSIARGIPFAYEDGVIESITDFEDRIIVNTEEGETYYIPSGLDLSFVIGDSISQFDPLVSGISLYDWVNGSDIMSDLEIYSPQYKGCLLYSVSSGVNNNTYLTYDREFFNTYASGMLPASMMFSEIELDPNTMVSTFTNRATSLKLIGEL